MGMYIKTTKAEKELLQRLERTDFGKFQELIKYLVIRNNNYERKRI